MMTIRREAIAASSSAKDIQAQLRNAFECSAIEMALVSLDGRWMRVNRALTNIVGYSEEELLRKTFKDITHPDDLSADDELREKLLAGGTETYQLEKRYFHERGHRVWILLSVSLVRSCTGEPLHFAGQIHDISQRKEAEQRLRASEARYRALSDRAPVGIFETDSRGDCRFVNRRWEEITGASSAQAMGQAWFAWVCEADRARVLEAFREAADHRRQVALEFRVQASTKVAWVWGRALALRNEDGEVTGFLGTLMDVSARKQSEAGLRHAAREKDAMLKEIHHRAKNNLQVISSLLYFQSKELPDASARALFHESHGRVRSMALVHEKLYQSSNFSEIDFADYARGLAAELHRAYGLGPEGIDLTTDLESIRMDVDLAIPCGLILNELLTSAFRALGVAQRGGSVGVELRRLRAGEAMLAVAVRGPGMASGSDAGGAATLTTELVKMFTSQIDGRFEVESRDGAKFRVMFALGAPSANERDGGETS
jgi:PAS domain S-box-containing protein